MSAEGSGGGALAGLRALLAGRPIDAVVIGASAGGVGAVSRLLSVLPPAFQPSVLIVIHLSRDRPSVMPQVLAARCALPVQEAEDKQPIAPGRVYLAAPDYHLLVDVGPALALSADDPVHYSRPSIDVLFASAADVYGARLLGLILTGANEDGARGLLAVAEAGGVTVVEDPTTAEASAMPAAAIKLARPQAVLALDEIAALLRDLG